MRGEDFIKIFNRAIAPLKRKVQLLVTRAIINIVKDSEDVQLLQVDSLPGETKDDVEHFQHFGFSSNPPADTEAVLVSVNGSREHGIIIATNNREFRRKDLAPGDMVIFNKNGKEIHLKGDNIEALCVKLKINNENYEYVTINSELIQAIIDARTFTLFGPQPLLNAADPFPSVKTRLDTFKV